MARLTVEDCIDKVDNRFELVLLAGHRSRQISQGAPILVDRDDDKNPVVALREIAEQTLSPADLKEDLIHSLQKHVEVDEPEAVAGLLETNQALNEDTILDIINSPLMPEEQPQLSFANISEEELLVGIESLVAPEKNEDF